MRLNLFKKACGKFLADLDEIRPQHQGSTGGLPRCSPRAGRGVGPSIGPTIDQIDSLSLTEVGGQKE